jgi:hypothetical protein
MGSLARNDGSAKVPLAFQPVGKIYDPVENPLILGLSDHSSLERICDELLVALITGSVPLFASSRAREPAW